MADELFEDLTPPPGGLQRLREAVELERRRRVPWTPVFATVAMAAAAAVFVLTPTAPSAPMWTSADNPALARLGYAVAAESGLEGTAMRPEIVGGVRVYWLGGGAGPGGAMTPAATDLGEPSDTEAPVR